MPKPFSTHPIVHLAIDVQSRYLRSLSRERQKDFPRAIRHFADRLRWQGIPTIWITLLGRLKFHSRQALWTASDAARRKERQLRKFDLCPIAARLDEDVFVKRTNNTFDRPLIVRLRDYGTSTVIVTGMNTRSCVAASIHGAVRERFCVLVVTDLLADMTVIDGFDVDPAWHRRSIEARLPVRAHGHAVEFYTSRELLQILGAVEGSAEKLARRLCGPARRAA